MCFDGWRFTAVNRAFTPERNRCDGVPIAGLRLPWEDRNAAHGLKGSMAEGLNGRMGVERSHRVAWSAQEGDDALAEGK
jgi:hypothetical protein